ncbi:MAG: tRNA glutamyl-Q(34) synthetase GluQRS [Rhodobacteraceae bacterium]|nr:tRNA glutamyl-Q(34) synthetase GluQRS [Paracoccaceae bacterium]
MAYVTRFAPSPTGPLHLGHAFSALTGFDRAQARGGQFLLRVEDTDSARVRAEHEAAIYDDLHWLGVRWQTPVRRQSEHLADYAAALDRLIAMGLCYPCRCTRADIHAAVSAPQEGVTHLPPDGMVYPGTCRHRPMSDRSPTDAIRLNIRAALQTLDPTRLSFTETGPERAGHHRLSVPHLTDRVGDVVLARRDIGAAAYHLCVVLDDALQGVTEVTRGMDLFDATEIQVLLQHLLQLPNPLYHHHRLIRDDQGKRLAKRDNARALSRYRAEGATPQDIRRLLGL